MGKFDLKELIAEGKVSNLGTKGNREQIEYIHIDLIDDDPNNFYELSGIEELAANIELLGLQQPIRVRANSEAPDRVIIVSGHRRRAAIRKLVDEGREDLAEIPCIREVPAESAALQELRLIYANSDTRKMSAADISKQAERVEALLYQLKEEGYEFPGRMRDHVAEACNVSKSKLARLKMIRDNLNVIWMPHWENGALSESVAYALAQMPAEDQRALYLNRERRGLKLNMLYENTVKTYAERLEKIAECKCPRSKQSCANQMQKREHALNMGQWEWLQCDRCCSKCTDLLSCKNACPLLADEIKRRKEERKMEKQQAALEQEAKDRPYIEAIQKLWYRFGEARIMANMDVEDVFKAMDRYIGNGQIEEAYKLEAGEGKVTRYTDLPYGYTCKLDDVQKYVKVADALKCSLDWLFCRTDDFKGKVAALATPAGVAWYPPDATPPDGAEIVVIDHDGDADFGRFAAGTLQDTIYCDWPDVACWTMAPDRDNLTVPPVSEPPAEGWLPLQWIPGTEMPEKDKQLAAVKLVIDGMEKTTTKILAWDEFSRRWSFPNGAGTIEAKCVGWFPLPAEEADANGDT